MCTEALWPQGGDLYQLLFESFIRWSHESLFIINYIVTFVLMDARPGLAAK